MTVFCGYKEYQNNSLNIEFINNVHSLNRGQYTKDVISFLEGTYQHEDMRCVWYEPVDDKINEGGAIVTKKTTTKDGKYELPLKVKVKLVGGSGNAFAILGGVTREMRKAGFGDYTEEFTKEATSGDYDKLLQTCMKWVDVL